MGNGNEIVDEEDEDHGDEVGDEDVIARVRQICPQVCGAELGHQHLVIIIKSGLIDNQRYSYYMWYSFFRITS